MGDVATFFDTLAERTYESDASQALQVPLFKNRERLFTFLQHDGVSWNNNLAENAIKRISNYRDDVGRSAKEAGFTEHSVLLSIYQTCHIRDISFSFLKFLLSRERDVDAFAAGKRHRQRGSSSIQRDTCHLRSFRFAGGKLRTLAV
jgi:chloramphenicol O-acetyltransferase